MSLQEHVVSLQEHVVSLHEHVVSLQEHVVSLQEPKIVIFSKITISFNICLGCSKEPYHREGSLEYPQHIF